MSASPVVRCAIYTRTSSEQGLEQSFNTVQAQRESAEAYILSHKQDGWHTVPTVYNDGGFSGASLERPALKQRLSDIEPRSIDCVVVYKVERRSRSLLDFARLLSLFDNRGVSFVSVTQTSIRRGQRAGSRQISCSPSQFEREIDALPSPAEDRPNAVKSAMPSIAFRATLRPGSFGIARAVTQCLAVIILPSLATAQTLPDASNCGNIVQVSDSQRMSPFDVDRFLCLPPNFSVSVYARVPAARFLAMTPDGKLLVSQPGTGSIALLEKQDDGSAAIFSFGTGLARPQDMLFHDDPDGGTYLYVAEATRISRYPYATGDYGLHDGQVLIDGLPSSSSDELRGAYAHELKNIAVDNGGRIYVSIASATNADPSERYSNPVRGTIYVFDPDGSNGRLYAQGLRNAEGVRFLPGTDLLWAAVNNRDNLAYPFHDDSGWYGQVLQEYVNDHPPDEFTFVRDGGDYGWPFANPNPETDSGWDNLPFDADMQNNADGLNHPIDVFDRITKGIPAHSAPLGLTFLQNTNFPGQYANGALIALHGSWNRNPATGYKVIYFPWNSDTQLPGAQQNFASGWLDGDTGQYWGRPVATAIDFDGAVFISDDYSGTIYRVTYSDPGC